MMKQTEFDLAIIGAGAAGMMSAIWAARTNPSMDIILIDGAKKLGAKILVAGGGRCNITNRTVTAEDFGGGSRNAIKKVLKEFTSSETIEFFNQIGVSTKEEPLGKIFPVSNSSKEVIEKLLTEIRKQRILLLHPFRVAKINFKYKLFEIMSDDNQPTIIAKKIIIATGGKALPKSGSDGMGYVFAKKFGHSISKSVFPALVPITLQKDNFLLSLKGIAIPAKLTIRVPGEKKSVSFEGSTLFTHFGISGPNVLNISRYYLEAKNRIPATKLEINFLPKHNLEEIETELIGLSKQTINTFLKKYLPQRLVSALLSECDIDESIAVNQLSKVSRKNLLAMLFNYSLPVTGNRGFTYAEVTAGGIPLNEIILNSMESRKKDNLYLCGEILNVDGKIGGYNFQWAWSSGVIAGKNAATQI